MLSVFRNRDDVDLAFAKTKPRFDCLDDSWTVFLTDRDAILNHLYARTEASNFGSTSTRTTWLSIQTRRYPCCWRKSKNARGAVFGGTATQNVMRTFFPAQSCSI